MKSKLFAVIALGELPAGYLTDRIGYRNSLVLSQLLLLMARGTLLAAYLTRSLFLFVLEAVIEGISAWLSSGTGSAYLYALCGEDGYLPKAAHAANFGTAGFLLSTASYCDVISAVQPAMSGYHPDTIGCCWDDSNPRIQLDPRGNRGYIELRSVKKK